MLLYFSPKTLILLGFELGNLAEGEGFGHEFVIRFLTGTIHSLGFLLRFARKNPQ